MKIVASPYSVYPIFLSFVFLSQALQAAPVIGQGTWESVLEPRDFNQDGDIDAYYDSASDLTWLADANAAKTYGYDTDGRMNWDDANAWASTLVVAGVDGWRLPTTIDVGNDGLTYINVNPNGVNIYTGVDAGYNLTTHSELSNLWYNVLGNIPYYDTAGNSAQPGWGLTNTANFQNLEAGYYWSETEYAPSPALSAWYFQTYLGNQYTLAKREEFRAWAVQSGDVAIAVVPLPPAFWLLVTALMSLTQIHRKPTIL